jgi:hypothetical protein
MILLLILDAAAAVWLALSHVSNHFGFEAVTPNEGQAFSKGKPCPAG